MRQYLVKVHCCGSRWLVHVPAFDRWTPVDDKKAIAPTAKTMITALTGATPDTFGIDLTEARVVASIEEFAASAARLQLWHGDVPTGVPHE
ncbi:hypothetical protein [Nocardia sp. NPDC004604]|uniref:hypothetical protein n=1 Tax=Nocardia sp. NPDC004604 TaxID=3157013 RepID=UPI0033B1B513